AFGGTVTAGSGDQPYETLCENVLCYIVGNEDTSPEAPKQRAHKARGLRNQLILHQIHRVRLPRNGFRAARPAGESCLRSSSSTSTSVRLLTLLVHDAPLRSGRRPRPGFAPGTGMRACVRAPAARIRSPRRVRRAVRNARVLGSTHGVCKNRSTVSVTMT